MSPTIYPHYHFGYIRCSKMSFFTFLDILPSILEEKLFAVFLAEPVADITAVLITSICFTIFYKKTLTNVKNIDNKFIGKEETSIN